MKLRELIELIGDRADIYIDGELCNTDLADEALDRQVDSVHVKTDKHKDTLESLGYSFEVGV